MIGQQQVYNLPVTINGKMNYMGLPCDSQADYDAVRKEVEEIDFKSEAEMNAFFERIGGLLGVRSMCHKRPNFSPINAEKRKGEVRGCFPFADFARGRDVVEAFGIQDCADAIGDIIERVRSTIALEEPFYKTAMENYERYCTLQKNGETF